MMDPMLMLLLAPNPNGDNGEPIFTRPKETPPSVSPAPTSAVTAHPVGCLTEAERDDRERFRRETEINVGLRQELNQLSRDMNMFAAGFNAGQRK